MQMQQAGLLACSSGGVPSRTGGYSGFADSGGGDIITCKLTAAGQLRFYTGFPFNARCGYRRVQPDARQR